MKQTAMQDLREDLLDTIVTGSDALNEIEDEQIRNGAKTLFQTTINTIISRIDEELLEMEKQQIDDAWDKGYKQGKYDPYFDNEDDDNI
jgi:hypothetical protein